MPINNAIQAILHRDVHDVRGQPRRHARAEGASGDQPFTAPVRIPREM